MYSNLVFEFYFFCGFLYFLNIELQFLAENMYFLQIRKWIQTRYLHRVDRFLREFR